MAVYTHIAAEEMAAVLADYDVGALISAKGIAEGVSNSNYLVDTSTARFILTVYETRTDPADLPFFMALLNHLAARGCPVPRSMVTRDGRATIEWRGKHLALIEFLPGLSVSAPTAAQACAVGAAMGAMHRALADFGMVRANALGFASWAPLAADCGAAFDTIAPGLRARVDRELAFLGAHWPHGLPVSVIHADLFPDNVLMAGDQVSAMIDFYFACSDIRALDLAVAHAAWSFAPDGTGYRAEIGDSLVAGYRQAHGLSAEEAQALPILARGACLRFLLTRAWDWLNTPADALVKRHDPLAFLRRLDHYALLS